MMQSAQHVNLCVEIVETKQRFDLVELVKTAAQNCRVFLKSNGQVEPAVYVAVHDASPVISEKEALAFDGIGILTLRVDTFRRNINS